MFVLCAVYMFSLCVRWVVGGRMERLGVVVRWRLLLLRMWVTLVVVW